MKIVILNECFLSNEHIKELKKLGDVKKYDSTSQQELLEHSQDADIVIGDCYLTKFDESFFSKAKKTKLVQINSTGFSGVDVQSAKEHKVSVANVPGFSTDSVAELAITIMFVIGRKVILAHKDFVKEPFETDPGNKEHIKYLGQNFTGKTLGVVGLGGIGSRVAELGKGIGMHVIAWNRSKKDSKGIKMVSLQELFKSADVIVVSLSLNSETTGMITKELLNNMKSNGIFINIGMSQIVDQSALKNLLKEKRIMGASGEIANLSDKEIFKLDNYLGLPHVGWYTQQSLNNIGSIIVDNVKAFVSKKPINLVK